ncbi:hypothetical protein HDU87_007722 [Geranomyces variabilis]|uniref:Reticulon-like protein n=1 Tax=Geranomyces variabilis TaxID=109894 RepID=A0AAD5TFB2_9FUNG|nr:hypothetical protein HDU87_007722 [Geranomyces variabilis]
MATIPPTPVESLGADSNVAAIASGGHASPTITVIPQSVASASPAATAATGKARFTDSSAASGAGAAAKAQYVKDSARSLLLWENPLHSGIVLSSILAFNYVLTNYSPVRVITFALGAATLANLVFVNAWTYGGSLFTHSTANGGIKKPPTMWFLDNANRQPLSHSFIREWADLFVDVVNATAMSLASIVAIDDSKRSIEALAGLGFIYFLSCYISSGTLFIVATIAAFVTPRVYLANKTLIDGHVNRVQTQVSGHLTQLQNTAAKHYNNAAAQAKLKMASAQKVKKQE